MWLLFFPVAHFFIFFHILDIAINSVEKITKLLKVLTNMSRFDTTRYTDEASILDIEDRLKEQLEAIDKQ